MPDSKLLVILISLVTVIVIRSPSTLSSPVFERSGGGSRSRSRSRSKSGGNGRPADYGVDTIKISDDDAAFILGKGGKTKDKIARVSECEVELFERDLVIEFRGSKLQRRRAKKYAKGVMDQRTGPVTVTVDLDDDDDLTMLEVPQEAVGFVTGRAGNFLRTIEEEACTLMFFCDVGVGSRRDKEYEKLAIFGTVRGRRASELKVLSAVDQDSRILRKDPPRC